MRKKIKIKNSGLVHSIGAGMLQWGRSRDSRVLGAEAGWAPKGAKKPRAALGSLGGAWVPALT